MPCNSSQSWRNVCSRCWSRIFSSWFIALLPCLPFRGLRLARRSIDGRDVVLQLVSHFLLFLQQGLHVVYLFRLQLHGDRNHGLYSLFIGKDVGSKCFVLLGSLNCGKVETKVVLRDKTLVPESQVPLILVFLLSLAAKCTNFFFLINFTPKANSRSCSAFYSFFRPS